MRQSRTYNALMSNLNGSVDALAAKYHFRSHLGDQCLFTLVGLEHPELFYPLDCHFNYQLDTTMYRWVFKTL